MANDNKYFLVDYSQYLDSTGQHLTYAALSTYRNFSDELSEKEKRFLKDHLDSCSSCSARLAEVAEVEGETLDVRKTTLQWMNSPVFRYSIAAVLVIALGTSLAYYLTRSKEEQSSSRLPGQSIAAETPDQERFAPNPLLENFIGRTVRSASGARFLSPVNGDTVATPLTFRWEGGKRGQLFRLMIVDNKNVELWKGTTQTGTLTLEKSLEPGLYYAKMEADGVLVQVGKFIVEQPQR